MEIEGNLQQVGALVALLHSPSLPNLRKFLAEQVLPCVRINTSEAVDLIGVHVAVQVAVARVATGQEM